MKKKKLFVLTCLLFTIISGFGQKNKNAKIITEKGISYDKTIYELSPFGRNSFILTLKKQHSLTPAPGGEIPQSTLTDERKEFEKAFPSMTKNVDVELSDISGYSTKIEKEAKTLGKVVTGYRLIFLKHINPPTIRGVLRHDYVGKVSVAIVAIVDGREFITDQNPPRDLGTICPPDNCP